MLDIVNRNMLTVIVLAASLALSAGLWQYAKDIKQREMQYKFDGVASELVDHVQQRILTYQQALHGLRAFFDSSKEVTREEYHDYITSLQLLERYPGIEGLGFAKLVPRDRLSQHTDEIRKQGFGDYAVHPESDFEFYTPVVFIEPFAGRNLAAFGFNLYSETVRRSALVRSRDSGQAAITEKLTLVQETGEDIQTGLLMYLPLYDQGQPHETLAQRRKSIYGWVGAVFRMGDLMAGLGHEYEGDHYHMHTSDLSLEIYDGDEVSEQAIMYQSSSLSPGQASAFKNIGKIQVADHVWTSVIQARPSFMQRYHSRVPELVLITCIAFSLLLTFLVRALIRSRSMIDDVARSEERWRFALEGSGDGVWDWGLKNDEIKYSRRWKEMLGYQAGEVEDTYMEWVKRVHPDDLPKAMDAIREHIDDKTPAYSNEHRLQHKNGSWRWMLSRGVAVSRDESGHALRIIGTHTDITERNQSEAALKQQRDFTDAVVEIAGNIIVVLDKSGCFVRLNRAAEELTGFSRDQLLGKPVWDWVIPEEQKDGVKQVFENLKSGRVDVASRYENDWMTSDGNRITLDWHNTILRNEAGEVTHIVALGYNVTERKKDEENIKRLTRLYSTLSQCDHAIVHSSNEAELFPQVCLDVVKYGGFKMAWIGMVDEASQRVIPVASCGSGTEYLDNIETSINPDEPNGRGPTSTAVRESHPVWCQDFLHSSRTETWHEYGEKYGWKALAALPLKVNGDVVGAFNLYADEANAFDDDAQELLVQLANDVSFALENFAMESRRKQAEHQLSVLNTNLELRVKERTDELVRARDMADIASKAKSDFLSNMSHEIRTPLSAIIGFSEALLADDYNDDERERLTSTIARNGKHLQQIINDILDLSKIEAGQLKIEQSSTSIFIVMCEVDSLLGVSARKKGLQFIIRYHFPLPLKVTTDPTALKQILINLCSNAIKFTDEGRVQVDVSCDEQGRTIKFVVTDTGIGMTPEVIGQVFDPFTQADTTTSRKYGGTGLGLSISSRLAIELGGSISCESETGKGSSFTLIINNRDYAEASFIGSLEEFVMTSDDVLHTERDIKHLSGKILLVEDSEDNQQLIEMYVHKTGAKIDIADNGLQGVDMALADHYDLVLMDMQMPVMDGVEAIGLLRQNNYTRPIVALTANAMMSTREKCLEVGANDFMVKPIDLMVFYDILNKYLEVIGDVDESQQSIDETAESRSAEYYSNPRYLAIVEKFKHKLPDMVAELSMLVEDKNWEMVIARSHDLKGLGGTMGFLQITEIAGRLNSRARKKDYAKVVKTSKELEQACRTIMDNVSGG